MFLVRVFFAIFCCVCEGFLGDSIVCSKKIFSGLAVLGFFGIFLVWALQVFKANMFHFVFVFAASANPSMWWCFSSWVKKYVMYVVLWFPSLGKLWFLLNV